MIGLFSSLNGFIGVSVSRLSPEQHDYLILSKEPLCSSFNFVWLVGRFSQHSYTTFSCDIFQVETCGSVGDVGGAPRLLWTSAGALGLPPPSHLLLEPCSSATDRLCRELCDQHCDQRQNQNNLNFLNSDYKSSPLRQPRVVPMSLSAGLVQEEVFPGEKICGDFFEMG